MRHLELRSATLGAALALLTLPMAGQAAESNPAAQSAAAADTVPAKWKPQEIRYTYTGFTTAYNCDAAEQVLKKILLTVGAHPQTKVRATGCMSSRPSRNFFVTITTATPVPASEPDTAATLGKSEQELLDRMGVKDAFGKEQFAASWQTLDLSKDRKLDLEPGDCELMDGLAKQILPKLSVKVLSGSVQCVPKQVTIQTPTLKVSALVRAPSADEPKPKT